MMDAHKFSLFLVAAFFLSISPGPGLLYVLARTLEGGRKVGMASTAGTMIGGLVHVIAATLGLSAILMSSALAYSVLKYAGAAYLVYLGGKTLLASRRPLELSSVAGAESRNPLRQGILTEALNPKTAVFFFTFLPQFVTPGPHVALQFFILGVISVALNSLADLTMAFFAAPLARRLSANPRLHQTQQVACGGVLVGLGGYVALSGE